MSTNGFQLAKRVHSLHRASFALILLSLVLLAIIESDSVLIPAFADNVSIAINIANFNLVLFYVFTAVSVTTGIFLMFSSSKSNSRKLTFLAGSILLIFSFLPVVFQYLSIQSVSSGGQSFIRLVNYFIIAYFIALLLTYKLGIFFVGFSSFSGIRKILASAAFMLSAIVGGIVIYLAAGTATWGIAATGTGSAVLPALTLQQPHISILYPLSQMLEIISLAMFIAAFLLYQAGSKND